jgi:hypothetical protein
VNIDIGGNNIAIGSLGSAADANTIRIGTQGTQKATYIAGISGTPMRDADVVVSRSGRLGVLPSSARFKRDIQPLDERSQGLWQLRPVTFRYKQDPQRERQYGLIAEQVAKVYPELVVRGDKGEIESVQYRELIVNAELPRKKMLRNSCWLPRGRTLQPGAQEAQPGHFIYVDRLDQTFDPRGSP